MRLTCPLCGERDRREFYYEGMALERPEGDDPAAWEAYVHLRENPAGRVRDLWYHEAGCGAWLVVERDTVSHEITGVELAG
ncbi:sarcosine oxidase subunit delta [Aestuariibius sp. 2305UL40-4]|uniref:sarcosine oxidase subunit delta n=1 Tax=Aestuariibius violaceus TaxID=3234132 RepID=UPI00345E6C85